MDRLLTLPFGRLFLVVVGFWALAKMISAVRTGVIRESDVFGGELIESVRKTQPIQFWLTVLLLLIFASAFIALGLDRGDLIDKFIALFR